jgi:malate/lactate dehydrogenase
MSLFPTPSFHTPKIVQTKGATYYAIATVIDSIVQSIYKDAKTVLPVSVPLTDYQGQSNVSLSVPCIVGANGVELILKAELSHLEHEQFTHSADTLRQAYEHATRTT